MQHPTITPATARRQVSAAKGALTRIGNHIATQGPFTREAIDRLMENLNAAEARLEAAEHRLACIESQQPDRTPFPHLVQA